MDGEKKRTSYVCTLTEPQIRQVEEYLKDRGWTFAELQYAYWKASLNHTQAAAYRSGKLTIQGAGTADLVEFFLEPEVLKEAAFRQTENGDAEPDLRPHCGVDESGKGDFFGPLVVASVYTDERTTPELVRLGVRDSKQIGSSEKIVKLAAAIREIVGGHFAVVSVGNDRYNELYRKIGNLNRLLAWGHARVIENVLEKVPSCPRALSDKFGAEHLIRNALLTRGRSIELEQKVRGERDVAVAAASILARDGFLRGMKKLEELTGMVLPKGAGPGVLAAARKLVAERGPEILEHCAKTHFKTMEQIGK